jgi:hypothetical protein
MSVIACFEQLTVSLTIAAMEEDKTYSISVRLRRTTFEYAFVSVPMDDRIWEQHPDDPKKHRVNAARVMEIAKEMGSDPTVPWTRESEPVIQPHPWQTAPPRA